MSENTGYVGWNPWHGCTKISAGCRYCYVYRQDEMYGTGVGASLCRRNEAFDLPIRKRRDGGWKIPAGTVVFTCFTSDFLLKDADAWRPDCWEMMRRRRDCWFYFFTKRIDRLAECLPPDWGEGYENVIIGCTVENQDRADARLPLFLKLPIRHRTVIAAHGVAFSHHFFFDLKFYEYTEYLSGILRPFAQGFAALGGNHNPADEIVDRTAPTA